MSGKRGLRTSDFTRCKKHTEQFYYSYTRLQLLDAESAGQPGWRQTTDLIANPNLVALERLEPLEWSSFSVVTNRQNDLPIPPKNVPPRLHLERTRLRRRATTQSNCRTCV
jgi:hypothetical protein